MILGLNDFSKQSFSGYAIKDVVSVLNKSLMSCKIEDSVIAVELLLSGQTYAWEKIFSISPQILILIIQNYQFFCLKDILNLFH